MGNEMPEVFKDLTLIADLITTVIAVAILGALF
jgi:hypothetical protein